MSRWELTPFSAGGEKKPALAATRSVLTRSGKTVAASSTSGKTSTVSGGAAKTAPASGAGKDAPAAGKQQPGSRRKRKK
jgi:hypothetical protein